MSNENIRSDLVSLLESAQAGTKAIDPIAHSFESERVTGLEDAIKLIDKALHAERAARIKAAVQGRNITQDY